MSDKKDNVRPLPNVEQDSQRANLEAMRRNLPLLLETLPMFAQLRKAAYDAYLEAGFSEEQALKLAKSFLDRSG
jgi:hypothetical protein